MNQQNAVLLK